MAQNKAHVPKFGNWDNAGNVPYTVYFENARKGKGGRMINPNDPAENPEAFSSAVAPSPNRSDAGRPPTTTSSPPPRHEAPRRGGRRTSGSVGGGGYSVEQSPVHPYSYSSGKAGDSSEDGGGGFGLVGNSVDRSRGNETPTRGSAVPKFGDWDSNPASADGYTHIFNKVREEKQGQAGNPAGYGAHHGNAGGKQQHDDGGYVSSKFSCFGWCK